MEKNSFADEDSAIGTSSNHVDHRDACKLLENVNIRERRFVDLHAVSNAMHALLSSDVDWTTVDKYFHLDTVGRLVACFCGFVIPWKGGATFVAVGNMGKTIIALTFPTVIIKNVYPWVVHSFAFGLFRGLCAIGTVDVLAHWSPPSERVRLTTFVSLGHSLAFITLDVIQDRWQSLFHAMGLVLLSWSIVWILFVSNDPSTDRYISEEERNHLCETINLEYTTGKGVGLPYRSILSSVPVYILMMEFLIYDLLFALTIASPHHLNIRENYYAQGELLLFAILDLGPVIIQALGAWFIDYLRCKPNDYSIDKIHRILLFWGPITTLVFLTLANIFSGRGGRIICVLFAKIAFGLTSTSYTVILIDFAGGYAGFLKAAVNLVRIVGGHFIYPFLLDNTWKTSLIGSSLFTVLVTTMFVKYGTGDLQPWTRVPEKEVTNDVDGVDRWASEKGFNEMA